MDIDFTEYRLSRELRGHEDDVRGICVCGSVGIATSSRDRTVRFWSLDPSNGNFTTSKLLLGHTSFVGPLAWVPPNEEFPEGGIVSGGRDTLVLVWDLRTGEAAQTLKAHQLQVTGIALDGSDIVSASMDCTLRRWRKGQPIESWEAHKAAIQAVIKLVSGELVTGSSDTTLKLWKGRTCVHTFVGHTDTVRSLAVMPDLGILSASHDGSIRLWALTGQVLMEMVGHTSIVYSVDSHVSGLVVSGSEDRFAKIWKDGVCVQSIEHPGCVWDVKFLENGDIVTACSDGVVRIWTIHQDKIANSSELESFASQLSYYKCSRKRVGGLKLEELPGLEALQVPGTRDGQTKVVREGDNGVAYSWNMKEQQWDKIGEVVDGPDDSMKRPVLDGIEYDYVFDVDIGDGEPTRKLPYNRSDNPYDTADKWLLKENLPLSYRQQIVELILQNTGQRDFALDSSFRDPYTGSSAYVPGGPSNMHATSAKPTFKHIPKKGMLVFDVAQFDGILKKISEFNNALQSDPDKKSLSLTELEVSRLDAIVKILKDTSHYHSSRFSDVDITLLLKLLKSWPLAMIFPVIDILRMIILHPDGATRLLKHVDDKNDVLMEMVKNVTTSPALPANLLTSTRAVTNLFKTSCYYQWLLKHRSEILDAFSSCSSSNKNVQVSYATLILNYAVLLIENKDQEGQSQVLSAALEIAEEENLEVDPKFRALVAIGTLMLEGLVRKIAVDFDVENIAKTAKASKDTKIAEVGADIELIIKQN
ncbi:Phospholipase A-2-activating protein [Camellia lanceoleosa]|uniref:Phospholipase A-2-activating protein n=1 Tax=Camellia lanceoleosa TaxID=1840588 RepID=A0ACC0IRK4_9ERIC|nr:Phospholipase A-2-activating protein [Camellia lanceoleosa]